MMFCDKGSARRFSLAMTLCISDSRRPPGVCCERKTRENAKTAARHV